MTTLVALLLLGALPSSSQKVVTLQQTNLDSKVRAWGTVVPEGVFRLKSTTEGRIEAVMVSSGTWAEEGSPIGLMANKELAALIDSRGTIPQEIVETHWQKVYKPTRILCPSACFVLKSFVQVRQRVQPNALLFEAAKSLRLAGQVDPAAARMVRYGQQLEFWPVSDPSNKMRGKIINYAAPEPDRPGGTFSLELSSERNLLPGTRWEGWVSIATKRKVLAVPTAALLSHEGRSYLPVEVTVGATNGDLTEILAGAAEGAAALLLETAKTPAASRYKPGPEAAKRLDDALDGVAPAPAPPAPPPQPVKRPSAVKRSKPVETETPPPPPAERQPPEEEDPYAD
ncbi:MAG: hypothetical protein HZB91_13865 [Elusimicrobia bacterium]|nr:hypothetical protein [Elusimicrobiota bacterium]